ncbi:MAG: hypothetical protein ACJ77G_04540 [Solirubrobacteraceae bacterium]
MGLFGPKIKDGVASEGTVIRMAPTEKAGRQNEKRNVDFEFLLSIRVQGATSALEVGHTCKVPHDKVPAMGQQIPVTVSAGDPSRLRIEFGEMPTLAERALASARAAQAGDAAGAAGALGYTLRDEPPERDA